MSCVLRFIHCFYYDSMISFDFPGEGIFVNIWEILVVFTSSERIEWFKRFEIMLYPLRCSCDMDKVYAILQAIMMQCCSRLQVFILQVNCFIFSKITDPETLYTHFCFWFRKTCNSKSWLNILYFSYSFIYSHRFIVLVFHI